MTLSGFDVSHHQGTVDYKSAANAGHAFVVVKASEGVGYVDPAFATNRAKAHAAGLAVGLYHFARAGDPIAEAEFFCATTDPLSPGEFIVLDWEVPGQDPVGWCKTWLDHLAAKCNVRPLLYINQATRDGYNWSPVARAGHGLWLAKYDGNRTVPPSGAWPAVSMKQYTSSGSVPGVSGGVDVNVFYGDAPALAALASTQEDDIMAAFTANDEALIAKYGGVIEAIAQQSRLVERDADKTYGLAAIRNAIDAVGKQVAAADANDAPDVLVAAILKALPAPASGGLTKDDVESAIRSVFGGLDNS